MIFMLHAFLINAQVEVLCVTRPSRDFEHCGCGARLRQGSIYSFNILFSIYYKRPKCLEYQQIYTRIYTLHMWEGWARSQVRSIYFYIELPASKLATSSIKWPITHIAPSSITPSDIGWHKHMQAASSAMNNMPHPVECDGL